MPCFAYYTLLSLITRPPTHVVACQTDPVSKPGGGTSGLDFEEMVPPTASVVV